MNNFENSGKLRKDNIVGINWSRMPVAQMLLGCINDSQDELKLANKGNWKTMAEGIANGIDMYFANVK